MALKNNLRLMAVITLFITVLPVCEYEFFVCVCDNSITNMKPTAYTFFLSMGVYVCVGVNFFFPFSPIRWKETANLPLTHLKSAFRLMCQLDKSLKAWLTISPSF